MLPVQVLLAGIFLAAVPALLAQAPADPKFLEHMRAGLQARKDQRWQDAAREFEAAARLAPKVAEVWANLGVVRQNQGQMAAAAEAFRRAVELKPNLPGVSGLLSYALLMTGRAEAAVPYLEQARKEAPGNPRIGSWLGLAYLESGDYRRAAEQWEAARKASPKELSVLLYLARAYEGLLGQLNDQLYRLDAARARRIERVATERVGGASERADLDPEIAKWEAIVRAEPANADALANLAQAYQRRLDQLYAEIYALDPAQAEAVLGPKVDAGGSPRPASRPAAVSPAAATAREAEIREACTQCHRFPAPSVLPKREWPAKIEKMFSLANVGLLAKFNRPIRNLRLEEVTAFFETLAPVELDTPPWGPPETDEPKLRFERRALFGVPPGENLPGTGNVRLVELFAEFAGPELVVCDMLSGWVSWTNPRNPKMALQGLARLAAPDHAEVVDLDKDGRLDLLVAELGQVMPSDKKLGGVVWIRQVEGRRFEPVRIAGNLGRVADAQAADFDGDGDLDVVVAEFGWITVGRVLLLENRGAPAPGELPQFAQRTLDDRIGSIHVPVVDLNRDGRPDFVALISQHSETVMAFLNRGQAQFDRREIFTAPHPHWGFSGLQMIDFDGDGDLDALVTNGDTMDDMVRFKPYQGVAWLENRGAFPWVPHTIARHYGVMRAQAADLDGDGDMDVVASTWLPELGEAERKKYALPGLAWYEQTPGGLFRAHALAEDHCDRPTLDLGDFDGDGRIDIFAGTAWLGKPPAGRPPVALEIWRQAGKP
jgi:tetratricopeptide (TPR) repeat protein